MKKKVYNFLALMEIIDDLNLDLEIAYELKTKGIRPDFYKEYKEQIKTSIDDTFRLDWKCSLDEQDKIVELLVNIREKLQVC